MLPLRLPTLSALVFAPALGALLTASLPESRARLRRGLALVAASFSFVIAVSLVLDPRADEVIRDALLERHSWIPTWGVSLELGTDALSILLVAWVSLLVLVALVSERSEGMDRASTALVLCCETALLGLFLARDGILVLTFLGTAIAGLTLLLGRISAVSMRRFFFLSTLGLVLLVGLAAALSRLVYVQSGFASGELSRWDDLVLFPVEQVRVFWVGAGAIAVLAPQLPVFLWLRDPLSSMAVSVRILVAGGYSLVGGYLLFRFILPLAPLGAESGASALVVFALLGLFLVALTPKGSNGKVPFWARLLVAYQSLVLVGLLALREEGIVAALVLLLHQAGAVTALALSTTGWDAMGRPDEVGTVDTLDRGLFVLAVASLFAIPSVAGVLAAVWARSPSVAAIATFLTAVLALRVVRVAPEWFRQEGLRSSRLRAVLVPVLAYCLWLASSFGSWEHRLLEPVHDVVSGLSQATTEPDADP